MTIEQFFSIFITFHAMGGFISLIAGTIAVIATKGNRWHKKSGMIFYYGMMVAGISGIAASLIPGHQSPFLFVVGLFSIYLVLSGYRALRFKGVRKQQQLRGDKIIAWSMILIGFGMMSFGGFWVMSGRVIGWVLVVFGTIGLANAFGDLRAMRDLRRLRKKSLRLHISKISGAYIAAFTAFFVTNNVLPVLLSWLLPTLFGIFFIGYWLRKTRRKKKKTTQSL